MAHVSFLRSYQKVAVVIGSLSVCFLPLILGLTFRDDSIRYFYITSLVVFLGMIITLAVCSNSKSVEFPGRSKSNVMEFVILLAATHFISGVAFCLPILSAYSSIHSVAMMLMGFMLIITISKIEGLSL